MSAKIKNLTSERHESHKDGSSNTATGCVKIMILMLCRYTGSTL